MKIKNYVLFILLFVVTGCGQSLEENSERVLSDGTVIGAKGENDTFTWKGIPFAKPPIGELRWKAPQDSTSWNGTLEAVEFKSSCFQGASRIEGDTDENWSGSEDCLYLNIWTPSITEKEI